MSTRAANRATEIEVPKNVSARDPAPQFVSDVVADLLGALGYDYVTLTPGSSFRGLHDSLINYRGNRKPKMLLCTHEEISVAFAHAYAKAAQRPALVICHDLVGLMHASMAIFDAWCDRVPLLILGGSGPADPKARRPIEFVHSANTQGELARQFVKWQEEPATPAAVIDAIVRGHRIALTPPCGPVYISIDKMFQEQALTESLPLPDPSLGRYAPPAPIPADPQTIARAVQSLLAARAPIIVAGSFSYRPEATAPLVELVEALGAGYVETRDHVSFPTRHPHNLTGEPGAIAQADAVLAIDVHDVAGTMSLYPDEEGRRPPGLPAGQSLIELSLNDLSVNSWAYYGGELPPADIRILADPIAGIQQLTAAVREQAAAATVAARVAARGEQVRERHRVLAARLAQEATARAANPVLSKTRLVDLVWEAVKEHSPMLFGRALTGWPQGVWEFSGVGDYLGASAGGGVGYGPGAAVGAALGALERKRFPVMIIGDGDMMMAGGALWTAVHYRIPLLVVIDNNRSFGNDEQHQRRLARFRERPVENAWIGTTMFDPEIDYAMMCRAYGAWAAGPITEVAQCQNALRQAVAEVERGGVAAVDAHTAR